MVVGDSHLLFSGHYARSGSDLVISDDERKLVIPDYFRGTERPDLFSRDGASLSGAVVDALSGHTQFAQAGAAAAGTPIGKVAKLTGSASVVRNGVTVDLNIGDNVYKGDVVQAGQDSALGITFIDGTAFSLGSNARMVLNEMVYDPNGSSNSSLLSLVQGTITFVAGQTAKNGSMRIDTPVATMGIRGTAVLVEIGANDGPTKFSVLVEPGNHVGSYELFNRVTGQKIGTVNQAGIVTLVTPSGLNQLSITEQVKTLADMQAERDLIQQVFSMAFQKLNDANPKSNGGSSGSSYWLFGDDKFYDLSIDGQIRLTGLTTSRGDLGGFTFDATLTLYPLLKEVSPAPTVTVANISTPQAGGVGIGDIQSPVSLLKSFSIGDQVVIVEPGVGTAPFFNIVVPYVAGTARLAGVVGPSSLPVGFSLASLVTIDPATGKVSYDPSNFQFLGQGQTAVYTISFDSYGGPATANLSANEPYTVHTTLTLTLVGLNDAPAFSATGTYQYTGSYADALNGAPHDVVGITPTPTTTPSIDVLLTERPAETGSSAFDTAKIVLNFTDQDFSDVASGYLATGHAPSVHFVGATGVTTGLPSDLASTFGASLTIDSLTKNLDDIHGQLTANFTAPDHVFDYLAAGETVTLTYTIQITDANGATGTETVNIVVTGTNDAPVFAPDEVTSYRAVERSGMASAPAAETAAGSLAFTDADLSDTHTASATLASVRWSAGHSIPEGALAALQQAMTAAISAGEDSTGTGDGVLTWDFSVADRAVDFLACGETLRLTYNVSVNDGHGGISIEPVTIVITGSNDAPIITSAPQTADITERAGATGSASPDVAEGTINFRDADLTDAHCLSVTGVTASGEICGLPDAGIVKSWLTLGPLSDSTGSGRGSDDWSFSAADKYFDYLGAGDKVTLTYTVQVDDHHGGLASQAIEVTVTGSNDPAVIGDPSNASVTEDRNVDSSGNLVAAGHIGISDPDHGQSSFRTEVVAKDGDLGTLTLNSDGAYVYSVANAAVEHLGADQTRTDVFTVTAADGTSKDVAFVIHGVNDAPVISLDHLVVQATNEDRTTFSGLHLTDVDAASNETYSLQVQSVYGTTSLRADSGSLASIAGDLAAGFRYETNEANEEHVETVKVTVTDGHGASDSLNFIFSTADYPATPVVLTGTTGKDVFIGSGVAEQFVFAPQSGHDTILNFSASHDQINLRAVVTTDDLTAWIAQHVTAVGSDTLITLDSQDSITLKNVAASSLHASDFLVGSHISHIG